MINTSRALAVSLSGAFSFDCRERIRPEQHHAPDRGHAPGRNSLPTYRPRKNAADVAVRRIRHPPAAPPSSIRPRSYFFSANTQTTPPCGTLASMPMLLVTSASWIRCASTPHPDWIAMYWVPSIS